MVDGIVAPPESLSSEVDPNFIATLVANIDGQVSDISNHNTDSLAEGSTNLYFTDSRAQSANAGLSSSLAELSSNFYDLETNFNDLNDDFNDLSGKHYALENSFNEVTKSGDFSDLSSNFYDLESSFNVLNDDFNDLSGKHYVLDNSFNQVTKSGEFAELSGNFYDLESSFNVLNDDFNDLSGKHYALENSFNQVTKSGEFAELSGNFYDLESSFNGLYSVLNGLTTQLFTDLSYSVDTLNDHFDDLSENFYSLESDFDELSYNLYSLELNYYEFLESDFYDISDSHYNLYNDFLDISDSHYNLYNDFLDLSSRHLSLEQSTTEFTTETLGLVRGINYDDATTYTADDDLNKYYLTADGLWRNPTEEDFTTQLKDKLLDISNRIVPQFDNDYVPKPRIRKAPDITIVNNYMAIEIGSDLSNIEVTFDPGSIEIINEFDEYVVQKYDDSGNTNDYGQERATRLLAITTVLRLYVLSQRASLHVTKNQMMASME